MSLVEGPVSGLTPSLVKQRGEGSDTHFVNNLGCIRHTSLWHHVCCLTGAVVEALQLWSKAETVVMQQENVEHYQQVLTLAMESMEK